MASKSPDPTLEFIDVAGVKLAYREVNPTSPHVLILLHGLAESSEFFWRPLVQTWGEKYRIIAFDLLGHGHSDSHVAAYAPFRQAALIKGAFDQLKVSKASFIAHSLGGMVSIAFAVSYPECIEKLVLYSVPISKGFFRTVPEMLTQISILSLLPSFPLMLPYSGSVMKLSPPSLQRLLYKIIFRQWIVPFDYSRADFKEFRTEMVNIAAATSGIGLEKTVRNTFLFANLYDKLSEIKVPTLFIKGSRDFILTNKMQGQYVDKVKHGKSVVLRETSHISLLDDPARFLQAVESFLNASQ